MIDMTWQAWHGMAGVQVKGTVLGNMLADAALLAKLGLRVMEAEEPLRACNVLEVAE